MTLNCCRRLSPWAGALLLGGLAGALHADPHGLVLGPRVAASAGTFSSLSFDHEALFANPAGLASIQDLEVTAQGAYDPSPQLPLAGAAVFPVGERLGLGLYGAWTDRGFLQVRDSGGSLRGGVPLRDLDLGLALGVGTAQGFSGGLALRGVWSNQPEQVDRALSMDLGGAWQGAGGWQGGLGLQGVAGSGDTFEHRVLRWALAKRVQARALNLLPALAFSWQAQGDPYLHLGLEARLNAVALRAGYEQRFVGALFTAMDGLDLGAGLGLGEWSLDYALRPSSPNGTTQWVSLTWAYVLKPPPLVEVSQAAAVPLSWSAAVRALGPPPELSLPVASALTMQVQEDPLKAAKALEAAGQLEAARAEYQRLTLAQPQLLGAWRGLGDLSYKQGDKEQALRAYQALLRLQPDADLAAWLQAYRLEGKRP